jgi:histidine triad (HIT) family protein
MLGRCSDTAGVPVPPVRAHGQDREVTMADSSCVFCEIVTGERAAHEVWRDEEMVAFLDHSPLFEGHVLVVPAEHHETLADLPPQRLEHYFATVQRISARLPHAMDARGTLVVMNNAVSQSVPHLHTHVVPRTRGDGLRGFFWPRTRYESDASAASVAARIRTSVSQDVAEGDGGGAAVGP